MSPNGDNLGRIFAWLSLSVICVKQFTFGDSIAIRAISGGVLAGKGALNLYQNEVGFSAIGVAAHRAMGLTTRVAMGTRTDRAQAGTAVIRPLEPRMNRPLGVTILALFYLLGAVLFLLVLVVAILQPSSLSGLHNSNLGRDIEHARTYQGAHALLILIFAGIGLGLWFLQSWARWTVLVIAGADLARRAVTVVLLTIVHLAGFHRTPGTFFWFATAISAAMYFYLRQQHVKRAFNERHLLIGTEH